MCKLVQIEKEKLKWKMKSVNVSENEKSEWNFRKMVYLRP